MPNIVKVSTSTTTHLELESAMPRPAAVNTANSGIRPRDVSKTELEVSAEGLFEFVADGLRRDRLALSEFAELRHEEILLQLRMLIGLTEGESTSHLEAWCSPEKTANDSPDQGLAEDEPAVVTPMLAAPVEESLASAADSVLSGTEFVDPTSTLPAESSVEPLPNVKKGLFNLTFKRAGERGGLVLRSMRSATRRSMRLKRLNSGTSGDIAPATLGRIERFAQSVLFEVSFAFLIGLNALVMAIESQYIGIGNAYALGYHKNSRPAEVTWPGAKDMFEYLDVFFGTMFTLEVIILILAKRTSFVRSAWNWFDLCMVATWLAQRVIATQTKDDLPLNPGLLRIFRLLRLLRLLRLVKTMKEFDVLHLMVGSIKASSLVLFWTFVCLFLLFLCIALIQQFMLEPYIVGDNLPLDDRKLLFKYFGTLSRCMLSMFELTLGNWVPISRCLYENVSEWYGPFVLLYQCIVGFAFMTVIRGIFLHETFQVASQDDELMIMKKDRQIKRNIEKMNQLMKEADDSGDGFLDKGEFIQVMSDPRVRVWLAAMELEVRDAEMVFRLLDDGDGRLSAEELVKGFSKLKGSARSIDVVALMQEWRRENDTMQKALQSLEEKMDSAMSAAFERQRAPLFAYKNAEKPLVNKER